MNVTIDSLQPLDLSVSIAFVRPESQVATPQAVIESISVPGTPELRQRWPIARRALATSALVIGTITAAPAPAVDVPAPVDLRIESVLASIPRSAAEEYAQLRQSIIAAGIPLLSDEEVRQEIRERKGLKD